MPEEKKEIEKPWCTYSSGLGLSGFGKIVRDEKTSVNIKYSERQLYPPECWDSVYVTRFDTLDEAVEYYIKNRLGVDIRDRQLTPDEVRENAWRDFSSYFEKKKN
jgi:hypothetical protein